jgi:hypothetical protein
MKQKTQDLLFLISLNIITPLFVFIFDRDIRAVLFQIPMDLLISSPLIFLIYYKSITDKYN